MANTIHTDSQEQSASKGGGSSSKWGRLLFTVETDQKRVGLEILIRAAVSVFAVFLSYFRGNGLMVPTLVLFVLFCAWPLLHMGDQMELYQGGIVYQGELYAIGVNTRIVWENRRGCFLPINDLLPLRHRLQAGGAVRAAHQVQRRRGQLAGQRRAVDQRHPIQQKAEAEAYKTFIEGFAREVNGN